MKGEDGWRAPGSHACGSPPDVPVMYLKQALSSQMGDAAWPGGHEDEGWHRVWVASWPSRPATSVGPAVVHG
jgi:hypothetical protein